MKKKNNFQLLFILFDVLTAFFSWTAFFLFRKGFIDPSFGNTYRIISLDPNFYYGLAFVTLMWIFLYYLSGQYKNVLKKTIFHEFWQTIIISIIGSLLLFFTLLLDDFVDSYETYYKSLLYLFTFHFILTYIPRSILAVIIRNKIQTGKINFNTLMVGSNDNAVKLYNRLINRKRLSGYSFVGFVNVIQRDVYVLKDYLTHLGSLDTIKEIIKTHNIEEVIIAIESKEHDYLEKILYSLEGIRISIKAIPDKYDLISGRVKISSLFDEPLIVISHDILSTFQLNIKRTIDVLVSAFVLILFLPLYLVIALGVMSSSPGPIFYKQKRVGQHGKKFYIYKFRTMFVNSESNGPALSSENDKRITKIGKFLRKVRLDEIPQFYNVLIGDMSLVGPRPERQYFIDQIVPQAPHYIHLLRVKPGITSWGQVKFGYAKNIDEMIERLQYDIIYIENMSIFLDIKILLYTVKTVVMGKGL